MEMDVLRLPPARPTLRSARSRSVVRVAVVHVVWRAWVLADMVSLAARVAAPGATSIARMDRLPCLPRLVAWAWAAAWAVAWAAAWHRHAAPSRVDTATAWRRPCASRMIRR